MATESWSNQARPVCFFFLVLGRKLSKMSKMDMEEQQEEPQALKNNGKVKGCAIPYSKTFLKSYSTEESVYNTGEINTTKLKVRK